MWVQNKHSHFVAGKERPGIFAVAVIGFRQCLTVSTLLLQSLESWDCS